MQNVIEREVLSDAASLDEMQVFIESFEGLSISRSRLVLNSKDGGIFPVLKVIGAPEKIVHALTAFFEGRKKKFSVTWDDGMPSVSTENYTAKEVRSLLNSCSRFVMERRETEPPIEPERRIKGFSSD